MKLLFVVNPISGGIDKEPFLKRSVNICEYYGIDYRVFKTTGKNDQENLQAIVTEYHPDKVASVGGDGTTLFTGLSLLNHKIPMGIVPFGSANGMAIDLNVNPDPVLALKDILMSNLIGELGLIVVNDQYHCLHIGDVGINAAVVASYAKDPNRGMITYAKYFIEQLNSIEPFDYKITYEGQTVTGTSIMIGICNGRKFGTGVPLNLTGNPFDDKFELVIIETINAFTLMKAGLARFDETFIDSQSNEVIAAKEAMIHFSQPRLLQLDGEVIGKFETLKIRLIPGAIRLLTHLGNKYMKST